MLRIAATCPIAYPPAMPRSCTFCVCTGVDQTLTSTSKLPSVALGRAPYPGRACISGKTGHSLPALVLCPTGDPPLQCHARSCCIRSSTPASRTAPEPHTDHPPWSTPIWASIAPSARSRILSSTNRWFSACQARATPHTRPLLALRIACSRVEGFAGPTMPPIRLASADRPCHTRTTPIITIDRERPAG